MDFRKMGMKGVWAILTFITSYLATHNELVMKLIPDNIEQMTVSALIASALVMIANWVKHKAG